jgi:hypothetical protein
MEIKLKTLKKRYPKMLHKLFKYGDTGLYEDNGLVAYEHIGITKKYSSELLKMVLDRDFDKLEYYDDDDIEFEDRDPSLLATYAPVHALIALAELECYDGSDKIMDDWDDSRFDDENYLFAFDYFFASAYYYDKQNDYFKLFSSILLDRKHSEYKRACIFYIFKEIDEHFKDETVSEEIKDTVVKFLDLNDSSVMLRDLAKQTLLLIKEEEIIKKYFIEKNDSFAYGSNQKFKMIYIPININIVVYCNQANCIKINKELESVPLAFTEGLLKFFDTPLIDKLSLISSFIRVEDLLGYIDESEENDVEYLNIIESATTTYSKRKAISAEKFLNLYKEHIEVKSLTKDEMKLYTLQGVLSVENDDQDDFIKFMEKFNKKEVREEIMIGFDNLIREINEKEELDAILIFLGVTKYDISNLLDNFEDFLEFVKEFKIVDLTIMSHYSIYKRKLLKPILKELFVNPFKKIGFWQNNR